METDETKTVDLGDHKIELPKEEAEALIAWRDNQKQQAREVKSQLDQINQRLEDQRKEAEESARKAAEIEAVKNKDVDALRETLTANFQQELQKREQELEKLRVSQIDGQIKDALSQVENLEPKSVGHLLKLIRASYNFQHQDGRMVVQENGNPVLKKDGQPAEISDVVQDYLTREENKLFFKGRVGQGSGLDGRTPPGDISSLKKSKMSVDDKLAFIGKFGQEEYRKLPL